jgi:hypothetical protein
MLTDRLNAHLAGFTPATRPNAKPKTVAICETTSLEVTIKEEKH